VALLLAVGGAPPATADVVTDWNTQLLDSIRAERTERHANLRLRSRR
jgi:hypothetical protein